MFKSLNLPKFWISLVQTKTFQHCPPPYAQNVQTLSIVMVVNNQPLHCNATQKSWAKKMIWVFQYASFEGKQENYHRQQWKASDTKISFKGRSFLIICSFFNCWHVWHFVSQTRFSFFYAKHLLSFAPGWCCLHSEKEPQDPKSYNYTTNIPLMQFKSSIFLWEHY